MNIPQLSRLRTRQDIAAALQVHPMTICRWVREGRVLRPAIQFGNFVRWTDAQYLKIVRQLSLVPNEKHSARKVKITAAR